jgi:hypothetical protein
MKCLDVKYLGAELSAPTPGGRLRGKEKGFSLNGFTPSPNNLEADASDAIDAIDVWILQTCHPAAPLAAFCSVRFLGE